MRKSVIVGVFGAVVAAGFAAPLRAQNGPSWVLVAGVNQSTITGKDVDGHDNLDPTNLTGFMAGVGAQFSLGRALQLQPEVHISMKGYKYKQEELRVPNNFSTEFTDEITARINYIDIPVLLRYNFVLGSDAPVTPFVLVGPNVGFVISCNFTSEIDKQSCDESEPDLKKTDFGLTVGGGVNFKAFGRVFGVSLRYQKGLSDLEDGFAARNSNVQIIGTWKFK